MAVTDLTSLWQLAATLSGETANRVILDASAPSTPYELTLSTIYDEVRKSALKNYRPKFAMRTEPLIEAPQDGEHDGSTIDWTDWDRWQYVYRRPADALLYLGFEDDLPDQGFFREFEIRNIPVAYQTDVAPINSGTFSWASSQGRIYPGTVLIEFLDDVLTTRRVLDAKVSDNLVLDQLFFRLRPEGLTNNLLVTLNFELSYAGGDIGLIDISGVTEWASVASVDTLNIQYAYNPVSKSDWTKHVFTNEDEAVGRYLADVTDPGEWDDEFVNVVAHVLAVKLATVHAKSSRMIKGIKDELAVAQSLMATSEEDIMQTTTMSTAEQARWS